MADYHLHSMHLESGRREQFRQARARLFDRLSDATRAEEGASHIPSEDDSRTLADELEKRIPKDLEYVLLDKSVVYPLKVGLNTIGRLGDNDVVLENPYVSRRHCAVLVHADCRSEIHDVASKNGTYVNGDRIASPRPIHSGDDIGMCDHHLVFIVRRDLGKLSQHAATFLKP